MCALSYRLQSQTQKTITKLSVKNTSTLGVLHCPTREMKHLAQGTKSTVTYGVMEELHSSCWCGWKSTAIALTSVQEVGASSLFSSDKNTKATTVSSLVFFSVCQRFPTLTALSVQTGEGVAESPALYGVMCTEDRRRCRSSSLLCVGVKRLHVYSHATRSIWR